MQIPALSLVLLLTIGCGTHKIDLPGSASVDSSFSDHQTVIIIDAFDAWKAATHGVDNVDVAVGNGGALHIYPSRMDGVTLGSTDIHYDGCGTMQLDLPVVWEAARLYHQSDDDELLDTTMHELAHAFGLDHVTACQEYDWAIVHFPPTFSPNPGYVGFAALSDASIGSAFNMTVGYPGCSPGAAPAGCVYPNQYQDASCQNVHAVSYNGSTSNAWPYSDGTSPNISYGCDINEGDSGSGIFRSSDNTLFGNATNNYGGCYTNCTAYGGNGTRISPDEFQYMLTFRNMAP